jgi:hypothetical protein
MYKTLSILGYKIPHTLIGHVKWSVMRDTIIDFFSDQAVRPEETLFFYYSGHGVPVADSHCNNGLNYDKEKYKDMLLDAAETVIGIFGFDRTLYGKPKDKKWWMELRRNKMNDVQAEAGVR